MVEGQYYEYDKDVEDLLQYLKAKDNEYVCISDLVKRLEGIDKESQHSSRNLLQILTQIDVLTPYSENEKWIPVSEEMPTEKGWYQCTCHDDDIWSTDIVRDLYYYPDQKEFVDNVRYEAHGLKDIKKFLWTKYVTAWQPLPKPFFLNKMRNQC